MESGRVLRVYEDRLDRSYMKPSDRMPIVLKPSLDGKSTESKQATFIRHNNIYICLYANVSLS